MEEAYLSVQKRQLTGKQKVKHLRKKGQIPAVVYGKKVKSIPLQMKQEDLMNVLHTSAGENVIIKLDITDGEEEDKMKKKSKKEVNVIIKEIQHHPLTMDILHVDFAQVSLTEKIIVRVPIKTKGDPIGVTRDSGILEIPLWEVEVECLPTDIPEDIAIQIENLEIGDTLHIRDITSPEGVKILEDPERTVISLVAPREVEEEEEVEEEVEELEVIREKEKEEKNTEVEKKEESSEK